MKMFIALLLLTLVACAPKTLEVSCYKNKKLVFMQITGYISFEGEEYGKSNIDYCIVKDLYKPATVRNLE